MIAARSRINLALLALVAALGALILLLPDPGPGTPPPAVAFDPESIERVVLERSGNGESLHLERRDGEWFATRPDERPVDADHVARALGALRQPTRSCYPSAEREPDEFGLDPPRAELRLDARRIAFGDRAVDGRRYLLAEGRLCLVEDVTLPILDRIARPPDAE